MSSDDSSVHDINMAPFYFMILSRSVVVDLWMLLA